MKIFGTPKGRAGCDQVDAIVESAQSELEQMFHQAAKKRAIDHGVGRTVDTTDGSDSKIQLDAQKRECEAQIAFHGGRAVELALHVVYARAADRIIGREYPGVCRRLIAKDTRSHSLKYLYDRMLEEFSDRDMKSALEHAYQESFHKGIVDLFLDEKPLWSFFPREDDVPFREVSKGGMFRGAEMTHDHSRFVFLEDPGESDFMRMPCDSFPTFLKKADAVYYESDVKGKRRNMRWTNYTARDHEYGRPYVVIGSEFFARLVGNIIKLSDEQWLWHPDFRVRWHERRHYIIDDTLKIHLMQNYNDKTEVPEIRSAQEAADDAATRYDNNYPEDYRSRHREWKLSRRDD